MLLGEQLKQAAQPHLGGSSSYQQKQQLAWWPLSAAKFRRLGKLGLDLSWPQPQLCLLPQFENEVPAVLRKIKKNEFSFLHALIFLL